MSLIVTLMGFFYVEKSLNISLFLLFPENGFPPIHSHSGEGAPPVPLATLSHMMRERTVHIHFNMG